MELFSVIMNLKNAKSTDTVNLQVNTVEFVADILASHVTYVYNLAFESGISPSNMQIAKVIVLHKGGDVNDSELHHTLVIIF